MPEQRAGQSAAERKADASRGARIDPVELLRGALRIPSPSGDEAKVAGYLVERMAVLGGEAFVDESGSAVCRLGSGPLKVTFLGHIDTVPGEIPVREEEGRLYGRGSVDAKGPFCAAVAAASRLSADGLDGLTLTLIGATEEEAPTSRGARHAVEAYTRPDLLIIGEPSGWEAMTLGYKGRLVLRSEVVKACHHSAGSESTAAEEAVVIWNEVEAWAAELNRERERIFERVQMTLQSIGSEEDGLEQRCRLTVGLRLPPWLQPESAREALAARLPGDHEYQFSGAERPYRGPRDTRLTRVFRTAIREQGGTPRFKLKTGTSDMNVVTPSWDVPVLAYGPGDSSLDHTPNEHVGIDDLTSATEVLATVFELLARRTQP